MKVIQTAKMKKDLVKVLYVEDVNGVSIPEKSAMSKIRRDMLSGTITKDYYLILQENEAPPVKGHIYAVKRRSRTGITVITLTGEDLNGKILVWLSLRNQWKFVQRQDTVINVQYFSDGKIQEGSDVYDPFKHVRAYNTLGTGHIHILNHDTAISMGYKPSKCCNEYFHPALRKADAELYNSLNSNGSYAYPPQIQTTHYANEDNKVYHKVKEIYENTKFKSEMTKDTLKMAKFMRGYSWGIEYEVVNGNIPSPMLGLLGLVPLIDGSISRDNYEQTTIPLSKAKGLHSVKLQCQHLTGLSELNTKCALHIHIGGIKNDKLTFLALYALGCRIQDEVYATFPYYKQHEVAVLGKKKEYSRHLPNLGIHRNTIFRQKDKQSFEEEVKKWHKTVFEHFACSKEGREFNRGNHNNARTPWGHKWNCPTRYYCCLLYTSPSPRD